MAVREVIQLGDPVLKALNKKIDDILSSETKQLIEDLRDTMRVHSIVGIAGPQIAENFQIFVTEPRATETRPADQADIFRVYINPIIIDYSPEEIVMYEGCGSVARSTIFGPVERSKKITIEAFDENGDKFRLTCDGLLARIILHEYDHLQGKEFTERMEDISKLVDKDYYIKNLRLLPENVGAQKLTIKEYIKL